jgi:uncharacterized protein YndB with AHSA1/START domain
MKKIELVYVIFIRTTPKKLWDAITKPEFTRQYWGGSENVSDWKKGSKWELVMEGEKDPVMVVGKVLESKPPKRLVLTWADPDDVADKSQVTYEIERLDDMVSLRVTHGDIKAGSRRAKNVSWGWPRVLSSMKSYLETGKGLNIFAGS